MQKADLHAVYIYLKKDNQILDINIHDHVAYNLKLHKIKLRRGSVLAVLGLTQCSITCFTWENCSLPFTVSKHYNPWQVNDVGDKFQQFIAHRKSKNISKFFWEFLNILYGLFSSTVEFFVQKEDEQVDVDLGVVEQFYYSHSLIL